MKFLGKKWIRIGSSKKGLDEFPEKEAVIWDRRISFEKRAAKENISEAEVMTLLDYENYFRLSGAVKPGGEHEIVQILLHAGFVFKRGGRLNISNMGAILLARNLADFRNLSDKGIRIITYRGVNKLHAIKDEIFYEGYAVCFQKVVDYIRSQIPEPEKIEGAFRTTPPNYPINSIREFVANALVHQDFAILGSPPLVEIFENRIEIANQGAPLIEPNRFIDLPSKARNDLLADAMRIMKICEKRGSGVGRAIHAIEVSQLPPPKIEGGEERNSVKVTIYSHKELRLLTREEQCRACYFHSCIRAVVDRENLTNASLCARLAIEAKNSAIASRIIKDTLEKGWIKKFDPDNKSHRYAQYVPFWA